MYQLNDKLRIVRIDSLNLTLEEFKTTNRKDGTVGEKWERIGYYANMEELFRSLIKKRISQTDNNSKEDITNFIAKLDEVYGEIKDLAKNSEYIYRQAYKVGYENGYKDGKQAQFLENIRNEKKGV